MDQIIRRAQLPDRPAGQLVDIGIEAGSIVVIAPYLSADAAPYDAAGRVACGGLIESHIHLDKARLPDVVLAPIDHQVNPVCYSAGFKADISTADIYGRAKRTLRESLLHDPHPHSRGSRSSDWNAERLLKILMFTWSPI